MRIGRRLDNVRHGSARLPAFLLTACVLTLSACEGGAVVTPSGPSASPVASATMRAELSPQTAPFAGPPFPAYGCAERPYVTPALDIVIVASRDVYLDQVSLRMLDGSSLGGPMVTFPQSGLRSEYGSTLIAAGYTRGFRFYPRFPCGGAPRAVDADLAFVDRNGATHGLTVSASLR